MRVYKSLVVVGFLALCSVPCAFAESDEAFSLNSEDELQSAEARLKAAEAALLSELPELDQQDAVDSKQVKSLKVETKKSEKAVLRAEPASTLTHELENGFDALQKQNATLKTTVKSTNRSLTDLKSDNSNIRNKLKANEQRVDTLIAELREARAQLALAEAEIERLSHIIDDRNRAALRSIPVSARPASFSRPVDNVLLTPNQEEKASEDMPVATVIVDNANLRTGPGMHNSPMMNVSKGTRLAIETRVSDWYRVIAPNGARAWISSDVVEFGKDGGSAPTRTVKVKGYDDSLEDQAFEFISKRSE